MKFKIYDYDNKATTIETLDKPIQSILVTILSGDETGTIYFEDGSNQLFDASECRSTDYFDGAYVIAGNEVDKWNSINPHVIKNEAKSYKRYDAWRKIKSEKQ